jgi:hypothetical protein
VETTTDQIRHCLPGSAFGSRPRELADWEMIALGGVAGALASLLTTPADVMKTRIMTAAAEQSVNAGAILVRPTMGNSGCPGASAVCPSMAVLRAKWG